MRTSPLDPRSLCMWTGGREWRKSAAHDKRLLTRSVHLTFSSWPAVSVAYKHDNATVRPGRAGDRHTGQAGHAASETSRSRRERNMPARLWRSRVQRGTWRYPLRKRGAEGGRVFKRKPQRMRRHRQHSYGKAEKKTKGQLDNGMQLNRLI